MSQPKPPSSPPPARVQRLAVPSAVPMSPPPGAEAIPRSPAPSATTATAPSPPQLNLAVPPPPPPPPPMGSSTPQAPTRTLGGLSSSSSSFGLFSLRGHGGKQPRTQSVGANHLQLVNDAIRDHSLLEDNVKEASTVASLQHNYEPVHKQALRALNSMRQLSTFIRKVAESQQQFSGQLKALSSRQWDAMVQPDTRDGMSSAFEACRAYVDRNIQQAEMYARVSRLLTEECCPALDQFVSLHAESCKSWGDLLANLKAALDKTLESIPPARKRAAAAIRTLYEIRMSSDQSKAKLRPGLGKMVGRQKDGGEIEKARKKAQKAAEALEAILEVGVQQHLEYELRKQKYLQMIQTLEEQRAKVLHTVLSQSVESMETSLEQLRASWKGLRAEAEQISPQSDIANFVQQTLRVNPPPDPSERVRSKGGFMIPRSLTSQLTVAAAELDKDWYYSEDNCLFGNSLEGSLVYQRRRFPELTQHLSIPHALVALSDAIEARDGFRTQGIFRISAQSEELQQARFQLELGDFSMSLAGGQAGDAGAGADSPSNAMAGAATGTPGAGGPGLAQAGEVDPLGSPHIPAALLKLWLRELRTPLVPYNLYARCIQAGKDSRNLLDNAQRAGGGATDGASPGTTGGAPSAAAPNAAEAEAPAPAGGAAADSIRGALRQVIEALPQLNRDVLRYLLIFLRRVAHPDNVAETKMGRANLAIVFAPSILRLQFPDPEQEMLDSNYATECMERLIEWQDELFAGLTSSEFMTRSPSGAVAPLALAAEAHADAAAAADAPGSPPSKAVGLAPSAEPATPARLAPLSDDDEDEEEEEEEDEEEEEEENPESQSPSIAAADYPSPPPLPDSLAQTKTSEQLAEEAAERAAAEAREAEEKQQEAARAAEEQRRAAEEAERLRVEQEERECPREPPADLTPKWKAIAQWDFEPDEDDDDHHLLCEFMSQDVVHVCFTSKWGKWVYVHNQRTDKRGYAPKVFLLKIKDL